MTSFGTENPVVAAPSPLASFSFPRTGKRGVPQQFPRRLYEMLEKETGLNESSSDDVSKVIMWSDSGKAFRIINASEFANTVLPKYFRTKKFSSFQRNLNLYGFAKVRRGAETDHYAHPSFARGRPQDLLHLRKVTTSSRNKAPPCVVSKASVLTSESRAISPSSLSVGSPISTEMPSPIMLGAQAPPSPLSPSWTQQGPVEIQPSPKQEAQMTEPDRGRLDLLAFALEQEAFTQA